MVSVQTALSSFPVLAWVTKDKLSYLLVWACLGPLGPKPFLLLKPGGCFLVESSHQTLTDHPVVALSLLAFIAELSHLHLGSPCNNTAKP